MGTVTESSKDNLLFKKKLVYIRNWPHVNMVYLGVPKNLYECETFLSVLYMYIYT